MADIKPDNPPATGKVSRRTFLRLFRLGIISSTLITTGAAALLSRKDSLADTSDVFAEFTILQKEKVTMETSQMLANVIVKKIHSNPNPSSSEVVYISMENGMYGDNQNCTLYYTKFINIENNIFEECYYSNSRGKITDIQVDDFPKFITTDNTTIRVIVSRNEEQIGNLIVNEDLGVAICTNQQSIERMNSTHLGVIEENDSRLDIEENVLERQINGSFRQQEVEYESTSNPTNSPQIDGYIKYDPKGNIISTSNNGDEDLYRDNFFKLRAIYEGTSIT